jgi:hypothetical protein
MIPKNDPKYPPPRAPQHSHVAHLETLYASFHVTKIVFNVSLAIAKFSLI